MLQTAPEKVNLERLKSDLMSISPSIIRIDELRVWSLTSRTNRIATCHLVLDRSNSTTEHQISKLLSEAKSKFLKQDIKCLTIEPKLVDPKAEKEESLELEVKTT